MVVITDCQIGRNSFPVLPLTYKGNSMKLQLLYYQGEDGYTEAVLFDKVVRFSKSEDGQLTRIHLSNNEVILTPDNLTTLAARIAGEIP